MKQTIISKKIFIKKEELCQICKENKKQYDIVAEKPIGEHSSIILYKIMVCEECKDTYIKYFMVKQNENN